VGKAQVAPRVYIAVFLRRGKFTLTEAAEFTE
jgi:hypothetical protein